MQCSMYEVAVRRCLISAAECKCYIPASAFEMMAKLLLLILW